MGAWWDFGDLPNRKCSGAPDGQSVYSTQPVTGPLLAWALGLQPRLALLLMQPWC